MRRSVSMPLVLTLLLAAILVTACNTGGPSVDPDPSAETIADYVVGSGRVATVTSISGVISDYGGGAVEATFAGIFGTGSVVCVDIDDPECQTSFSPARPWVPTSIAADGSFTINLPTAPVLDESAQLLVCGEELSLSSNGVLYVHAAPFGEPGSSPTATFARSRLEDPKTPVGFLADAALLVLYGYSPATIDVACVQDEAMGPDDTFRQDVDLRLRPGWNVMTWLQRSEADAMVLYLRTGEPDLAVPWAEPEQLSDEPEPEG